MSSYEDYDGVARVYDAWRRPVGVAPILGWLARRQPLVDSTILDAGCGTGQFSRVLLEAGARVEAVELSPGMLAVARRKLASYGDRARSQQGSILELPLADDSVDGAVINQVLHHLPEERGWSLMRAAFAELRRVVRPGGTLTVNTCSEDQIRRGYWYFRLFPARPVDDMVARYAPLSEVRALLSDVGFAEVDEHVPYDEVLFADQYLRPDGPLDPGWRKADSTWTLLSEEELTALLDEVRRLRDAGELEATMRLLDADRPALGQVTLLAAR